MEIQNDALIILKIIHEVYVRDFELEGVLEFEYESFQSPNTWKDDESADPEASVMIKLTILNSL